MSDTTTAAATTPTTPVTASARWTELVTAFALTIGSTFDAVTAKLLSDAVNTADDASLSVLASPTDMPDATWAELFPAPAVKRPMLNRAVAALRTAVNGVAAPAAAPGLPLNPAPAAPVAMASLMKPLPDDTAFLSMLVTGGRLNGSVTPADAAVAVRVALASGVGLYDVPDRLVEAIEAHSEALETPADASVYDVITSITEREYAPILRALGAPQRAISASERKKFLARAAATLFPGLRRFHAALAGWYEQYKVERSDPGMLIQAFTGGLSGLMPMVATDTSTLRSAAADLITMVNKLFSGLTAIPSARAMATDAVRILGQLNDPRYISAAGFTSRDEMLRKLGVNVTDHFARVERAVATYAINAMDIGNVPDAQLPLFAQQLFMLGATIPWDTLGTSAVSDSGNDGSKNGARPKGPAGFKSFPDYQSR